MARKVKRVDDDAPEITAELFAQMRPMKDVTPGMVEAVKAARSRGRPKVDQPRVVVSVRVSQNAQGVWVALASDKRKKLTAAFEQSIVRMVGSSGAKVRSTTKQQTVNRKMEKR